MFRFTRPIRHFDEAEESKGVLEIRDGAAKNKIEVGELTGARRKEENGKRNLPELSSVYKL